MLMLQKLIPAEKKKPKMSKDINTLNMIKNIGKKWKRQFLIISKVKI